MMTSTKSPAPRRKKKKTEAASSAVEQASSRLRSMAMNAEEGGLLGSEEDLMNALGVSRPTLRQAAALVAQDRFILIRRGVNGGYFAARPDSTTVSRMAALYLQSRDAHLSEVIAVAEPIRTELARLASRSTDTAVKAQLAEFVSQERAMQESDYRTFLRAERAFGRMLSTVAGNKVLGLFLNIVYDLTAYVGQAEDVYVNRPERVELYRQHRLRMATAILEGDEELAVLATRRCSAIVAEWIHEDLDETSSETIGVRARAAV
jgi:DNA-binding FadR family transcriptional regulator